MQKIKKTILRAKFWITGSNYEEIKTLRSAAVGGTVKF